MVCITAAPLFSFLPPLPPVFRWRNICMPRPGSYHSLCVYLLFLGVRRFSHVQISDAAAPHAKIIALANTAANNVVPGNVVSPIKSAPAARRAVSTTSQYPLQEMHEMQPSKQPPTPPPPAPPPTPRSQGRRGAPRPRRLCRQPRRRPCGVLLHWRRAQAGLQRYGIQHRRPCSSRMGVFGHLHYLQHCGWTACSDGGQHRRCSAGRKLWTGARARRWEVVGCA